MNIQLKLVDAIVAGDVQQVDQLLEDGADPNGTIDRTEIRPLHFAVQNNHQSVVDALLKAGADPTLTDECGESAYDVQYICKRNMI